MVNNRDPRVRLGDIVRRSEADPVLVATSGNQFRGDSRSVYAVASGTITARSGMVLGKGFAYLYGSSYDSDSGDITLIPYDASEDTTIEVPVFNSWTDSIADNTSLILTQINGHWSVTGAACPQ